MTQLGDNYSVPSGPGQLFRAGPCRNAILLSVFLPSFVSFSLLLSVRYANPLLRGSMPERSISRCGFLPVRDIPNGFPRRLRKSRTGKFLRKKKLFTVALFVRLFAFSSAIFIRSILPLIHVLLAKREITINRKRLSHEHIKQLQLGIRVFLYWLKEGSSNFEHNTVGSMIK